MNIIYTAFDDPENFEISPDDAGVWYCVFLHCDREDLYVFPVNQVDDFFYFRKHLFFTFIHRLTPDKIYLLAQASSFVPSMNTVSWGSLP